LHFLYSEAFNMETGQWNSLYLVVCVLHSLRSSNIHACSKTPRDSYFITYGRSIQTWLICCWFSFNYKQTGILLLDRITLYMYQSSIYKTKNVSMTRNERWEKYFNCIYFFYTQFISEWICRVRSDWNFTGIFALRQYQCVNKVPIQYSVSHCPCWC
jgi:hypothetical protein